METNRFAETPVVCHPVWKSLTHLFNAEGFPILYSVFSEVMLLKRCGAGMRNSHLLLGTHLSEGH